MKHARGNLVYGAFFEAVTLGTGSYTLWTGKRPHCP
jgi:hypothetical protein